MGLFGIAEIVVNLERHLTRSGGTIKVGSLWPTREEIRRAIPAVLRGTTLGSVLGVLPGGGPTLGAFSAYTLEKKISEDAGNIRQGCGRGRGLAGGGQQRRGADLVHPHADLGHPVQRGDGFDVGAMIIQGIQPGPEVMTKKPDLFWGMIASMWVGNAMLVIINLPMIGIWVKLLTVPLPLPRPGDPAVLLHRRLQPAEQYVPRADGRDLRGAGLHLRAPGFARCAVPAGTGAGSADGGVLPARHAAIAWRSDGVRRAANQPRPLITTALLLILMALPSIKKARQEAFQEEG